jgi:hypothetical protein
MASKNKTTETVATKPAKVLSAKAQTELDHTLGKHKAFEPAAEVMLMNEHPACGFCARRVARTKRRASK